MEDLGQIEDWLEIGIILAPHGLRGDLKVSSSTDFPERFEQPGKRLLQSPDKLSSETVELLSGRHIPGKNQYVIRLKDVDNRALAEALRGYKLFVSHHERPQLAEDEYHIADLINLEVHHQQTGKVIGIVTNILWTGNDLLEVKLYQPPTDEIAKDTLSTQPSKKKQTSQTVLIPFVKEIVPVVDLEKGRLEINPPPGLLELET